MHDQQVRVNRNLGQASIMTLLTRIIHQDEGVLRFRIGSPGVAGFGWC
jgi:hypothetical protein